MKTIRNSVFIGASLLGGCASVKDATIEKEMRLHAQRL
nr:urease-enhancing factor [Helicobacter pylori]